MRGSLLPVHDLEVKSLFGSKRNDFLAVEEMNWMTEWPGWLNSSLFILMGVTKADQKIVLLRVLKSKRVDISWPIRFVFLLIFLEPKNFLLISFWSGFSRMFLFYIFS